MKRREAKSPASDEQLALPFDRSPKAIRTNGAEPLAVRIPDAVRMTGIGRSKLYELIASGDLETIKIRSEEHTSELQSLMRISYAVFCLKKKKQLKKPQYN